MAGKTDEYHIREALRFIADGLHTLLPRTKQVDELIEVINKHIDAIRVKGDTDDERAADG